MLPNIRFLPPLDSYVFLQNSCNILILKVSPPFEGGVASRQLVDGRGG